MNFKPFLVILLLLLQTPLCLALGDNGYIKGNGGTGIFLDGHLRLLDFAEAGVTQPFFGSFTDPKILFSVENSNLPSEFPFELIARKISDLALLPRAATAFLIALKTYEWSFTDEDLGRTQDMTTLKPELQGKDLFLIARRDELSIVINRPLWKQLSEAEKAGLIFHEIVYGMTWVKNESSGQTASQSVASARSSTAHLFSDKNFMDYVSVFLEVSLNIPFIEVTDITISHWTLKNESKIWNISFPASRDTLENLCSSFKKNQITTLQSCFKSPNLGVEIKAYMTIYGVQASLNFFAQPSTYNCRMLKFNSIQGCATSLNDHQLFANID